MYRTAREVYPGQLVGVKCGELFASKTIRCHGKIKNKNFVKVLFRSRHGSNIQLRSKELQAISNDINLSYQPRHTSKTAQRGRAARYSTEELRAISEQITREYRHGAAVTPEEPKVVLLPVDPKHVYAYWNLGGLSTEDERSPIVLRVFQKKKLGRPVTSPAVADIGLSSVRSGQRVVLPHAEEGFPWVATIGRLGSGDVFCPLLSSEQAQLPSLGVVLKISTGAGDHGAMTGWPLLNKSGVGMGAHE